MSRILEQLKQAEAERERLIAERKRLETEADAAQADREREERYRKSPAAQASEPAGAPQAAPPAPTPQQQSRLAAGFAIAAAMGVVFWVGTLVSRPTVAPAPAAPGSAARAPEKPVAPELFRFDRDMDAFAARLREKGVQ